MKNIISLVSSNKNYGVNLKYVAVRVRVVKNSQVLINTQI